MADAVLKDWDSPNDPHNIRSVLPSDFQLGDTCCINEKGFVVDKAIVVRIHFAASKVMYDLEVEFAYHSSTAPDGTVGYTRIYNVDSAFLRPGSYWKDVACPSEEPLTKG